MGKHAYLILAHNDWALLNKLLRRKEIWGGWL